MPFNPSGVLDFLLTTAPHANRAYQQVSEKKQEDADRLAAKQEKTAAAERQARIDAQQEALRALQIETERTELANLQNPKPPTFSVAGREFQDTPEGHQAAREWNEQMNPSRYRGPQGPQPNSTGLWATDFPSYLGNLEQVERLRSTFDDPPDAPRPTIAQAREMVRNRPEFQDETGFTTLQEWEIDELAQSWAAGGTPDWQAEAVRRRSSAPTAAVEEDDGPGWLDSAGDFIRNTFTRGDASAQPAAVLPPARAAGPDRAPGQGWQARAAELRKQGLDDNQVISQLRSEGLIK